MSTYITKQQSDFIKSHGVDGMSTLDTYPKQLPDGRYLQINKCCTCKQYTFTGIKKVNTTNKVFFRWVPMYFCKHCMKTQDKT